MTYNIAILGCGDFLRWQADDIKAATSLTVHALFDPDQSRAQKFADDLGGSVAESAEAIFADPAVDIVFLFVPPWLRRGLFEKAALAGKHIILTKPLAASIEDCAAMQSIAQSTGIRTGVIYSRTGDSWVSSCKALLDEGSKGKLALYRRDWLHAYPQWNSWATDPEKNGGPFMDAMIHNMNEANFYMDRPMKDATMFSDRLSHPDMACADTESVIAHYEGGGLAHLFITWAADLAVYSTNGNDREHIDHFYLITDKGWHISKASVDGISHIRASKDEIVEMIPVTDERCSHYQAFAEAIEHNTQLPEAFADIDAAAADIITLRQLYAQPGHKLTTELPRVQQNELQKV